MGKGKGEEEKGLAGRITRRRTKASPAIPRVKVHFQFSINCNKDLHCIVECVSHEWTRLGGMPWTWTKPPSAPTSRTACGGV